MSETLFTHARLILDDRVVNGTLVIGADGLIREVGEGASAAPGAVDCGGDFLCAGLVEIHTDNMERHFVPRPKVLWPDPLAAALAHDAQMAAAGITTVLDAICVGVYERGEDYRADLFAPMIEAIEAGVAEDVFRIDHALHLRCELSSPKLLPGVESWLDHPLLRMVSLMDHTPGQRQWRKVEHLRTYALGTGKSPAEFERDLAFRMETGAKAVADNMPAMVRLLEGRPIRIASHDDTTEAHIDEAVTAGCTISEFPTTPEAAAAARRAGLATVAGAPNVVRGGSHSGGVAVEDLARAGTLDALSSDYVPASLLQAAVALADREVMALPQAIALVTTAPAAMLGLPDRGRLAPGLRADLVRFRKVGRTAVVREVRVGGRLVA